MPILEAAVEAAHLRFRPILMTSLAFILGAIPLVIATGAGANSRHSIGTGIVGGMTAATVLAIFFVPLFFRLFQGISEKGQKPVAMESMESMESMETTESTEKLELKKDHQGESLPEDHDYA